MDDAERRDPDAALRRLLDYYDAQPWLIRLVGGPADGRQQYVPSLPWSYDLPIQHSVAELWQRTPLDADALTFRVAHYQRSGHIADDGARLYEYQRPR